MTVSRGDQDERAAITPAVVATVGTDHHHFDRLVSWIDRFAADHPEVSCFVQSGTSAPPRVAAGQPYLPFPDLRAHLAGARVVVSHGGPATIMDARAVGHLPIVVPRDPSLGEHVDAHQMRFCTWMAARGQVVMAGSAEELGQLIEAGLADPTRYLLSETDADTDRAVRRFGDLIDGMLA